MTDDASMFGFFYMLKWIGLVGMGVIIISQLLGGGRRGRWWIIVFTLLVPTVANAQSCGQLIDRVDVRCYPDLQSAANIAVMANMPLWFAAGTYVTRQPLVIDYTPLAHTGFTLISDGAIIDARLGGAQGLMIQCSGGTSQSPVGCFYFHQVGTLTVWNSSYEATVRVGQNDLSDAQNSIKFDHLIANNSGSGPATRLNYVLNADLAIYAVTAGSSGLMMEQVQFSRVNGAMSGGSGAAISIQDGYTFANTFSGVDLEASPVCLSITSSAANHNTFTSLYAYCPQPVVAVAGDHNLLINSMWGGATLGGPLAGVTVQ